MNKIHNIVILFIINTFKKCELMAKFKLIRELAKERQISMRELASRIGKDETTLQAIIRNGSTNTKTIEEIASVLDVPVGVFFGEACAQKSSDGTVEMPDSVRRLANGEGAEYAEFYSEIIRKKDEQIDRLLKIIESSKL